MKTEPRRVERAHFQPTIRDSWYLDPKYRVVWIRYTDCLTQTRTVNGDIAYAKSWWEFKHSRGTSSLCATCREQIKAYIIASLLYPKRLTELQVDSIISFARTFRQSRSLLNSSKASTTRMMLESLSVIWTFCSNIWSRNCGCSMRAKNLGGIFVRTLRNLQVSITNLYCGSPWLTADPSALLGLPLPIFPTWFENVYYSKDSCAA